MITETDLTSLTEALAICTTELTILRSESAKLKKRCHELEHVRQLDRAEIINLRRQIQMLMEVNG